MATVSGAAENVQVVIRMRPKSTAERSQPAVVVVSSDSTVTVEPSPAQLASMGIANKQSLSKTFTFDRAYGEVTAQEALFNTSVAPVVDEVLRGFSCTVFAYGQTGTGKTYTMEGPKRADGEIVVDGPEAGIIPRAIKRIFDALPARGEEGADWVAKVSFLEIYNEKLDDLLSADVSAFHEGAGGGAGGAGMMGGGGRNALPGVPAATGAAPAAAPLSERLKILNDDKTGVRIAGLEEITVASPAECFEHLRRSIAKRATAETKCNVASSRSHCVFTITLNLKESFDGEDTLRVGKLNLVDLAGSECVGRSGATDRRAREAGNINQSLLTLGRVITALVEGLPHVPYRDSKLTRLLQESLGGKTKTCMIATVSPSTGNIEETLSTLEYASRAKNIKNRPEACARVEKRDITAAVAKELQRMRDRYRAQIEGAAGSKGYVYMKEEEEVALRESVDALTRQIGELEEVRAIADAECGKLRAELAETIALLDACHARADAAEAELAITKKSLEATRLALDEEFAAHDDTRGVLDANKHVGSLLTTQAVDLQESLTSAVSDVALLHSKISVQASTLSANASAGESFAAAAASRLSALAEMSDAFAANAADVLATSQAALADFRAGATADAAALTAALAQAKQEALVAARAAGAAAGALGDDVATAVTDGITRVNGAAARSSALTASALEKITASISAARDAATSAAARAEAFAIRAATAFAAHNQAIHDFSCTHATTLSGVTAAVERAARSADAALTASATAIENSAALREKESADAADALAMAFSAALDSFKSANAAASAREAAALLTANDAARAAVRDGASAAGAAARRAASDAEQWVATTRAAVDGASCIVQEAAEDSRAGGAAAAAAADAAIVAAGEGGEGVCTAVAAGAAAAAGVLETARSLVATAVSRARSAAVSSAEGSARNADAVGVTADVAAARAAAHAAAAIATATATADSAANMRGAVREWAGAEAAAGAALFGSTLVAAPPCTGATPAPRPFFAPSALVAASPDANITARVRAARGAAVGDGIMVVSPTRARAAAVYNKNLPPRVQVMPPAVPLTSASFGGGGGQAAVGPGTASLRALKALLVDGAPITQSTLSSPSSKFIVAAARAASSPPPPSSPAAATSESKAQSSSVKRKEKRSPPADVSPAKNTAHSGSTSPARAPPPAVAVEEPAPVAAMIIAAMPPAPVAAPVFAPPPSAAQAKARPSTTASGLGARISKVAAPGSGMGAASVASVMASPRARARGAENVAAAVPAKRAPVPVAASSKRGRLDGGPLGERK